PPTEISTLSLHDALPIYRAVALVIDEETLVHDRVFEFMPVVAQEALHRPRGGFAERADGMALDLSGCRTQHLQVVQGRFQVGDADRKSTRLNSSHVKISY